MSDKLSNRTIYNLRKQLRDPIILEKLGRDMDRRRLETEEILRLTTPTQNKLRETIYDI